MYDVIIIGCGVVGAATAYRLARCRLRVAVLEAQNDVANGTTKANSAIIHAGYDPRPGTLMAKLNVEGNRLTGEIARKLDVPFRRVGSLVVALGPEQQPALEELYRRGRANGVPGLRLLTGEQARALEPQLSPGVTAALLAPTAGIIDPWDFALAMAETAVRNGVQLLRSCPVTGITPLEQGGFAVQTPKGTFSTRFLVNAAGVQADAVHALLEPVDWTMRPSRGAYFLLDKSEHSRVSRVIFQCPGPSGKGVLVGPTIHGNLIVGPDAEPVEDRRDLGTTAAALDFVRSRAVQSVPGIDFRQNIRNFAGIRANTDQSDFIIRPSARYPAFLDQPGGGASGPGRAGFERKGGVCGRAPCGAVPRAFPRGEKPADPPGPPLWPGHLPVRDSHRGRDCGGAAQPHPAVQRQRRQAAVQCGHGPLPGRFLRPPGGGAHRPGGRGGPHPGADGPGGNLDSGRRDQTAGQGGAQRCMI